jgi:FkbM family methyltransferase
MPLLNSIRLFTNKLLAPAGLAIARVEKSNPWGSFMVTIPVGSFSIELPRSNPVSTIYLTHPDYMSQLAGLVTYLKKKYANMSAMDIGANVGDTACIIKTAADIPLVCIEGDAYTFGLLQKNIRQFQNVNAFQIFLGEKTGPLAATFEKSGWNTTIKPDQSPTAQTIRISSLDDLLAGQPVAECCKLVKIDAEGFDCSIIRGAKKFLQQTHPVITFEYNRDNMDAIGEKGFDTLSMLRDLGYSLVAFHDCNGRFFTAAASSDNVLIRDLLDYADGKHGSIYYFDLTMFHQDDNDIALAFTNAERARRSV